METLPRAPIVEAILDIRVELPREATIGRLEELGELIKTDYPTKRIRRRWEGELKFEEGQMLARGESPEIDGFLFWSSDEKQVTQFRLDGFTFSRLKPYQTWEQMQREAKRLWEIYLNGLQPVQATRLALRYINIIAIPSKRVKLEEYFKELVRVPQELPQHFDQFHVRVVLHYPDEKTKAAITQATMPPSTPDSTSLLFDIDVFTETRLEPKDLSIWENFACFRTVKNEIFKHSLTQKAIDLFK